MNLTIAVIAFGNFTIIISGMGTALYSASAFSFIGLVFALTGFKNMWYLRISSNLVRGFYYSGHWRYKPGRKNNDLVDDDLGEGPRQKNFTPLVVLGSLALLEATLLLLLPLLAFYTAWHDRTRAGAALGSLLVLGYSIGLYRYVYWNFRAIRHIRKR